MDFQINLSDIERGDRVVGDKLMLAVGENIINNKHFLLRGCITFVYYIHVIYIMTFLCIASVLFCLIRESLYNTVSLKIDMR